VTANVAPQAMHDMCNAAVSGDPDAARGINARLEALHRDLFLEANPIPVKWALHAMGLIPLGIRLPLTVLSEGHHQAVRDALHQADIPVER
jgi:4-hydroxy-tetrahydrodipicolinate synthase